MADSKWQTFARIQKEKTTTRKSQIGHCWFSSSWFVRDLPTKLLAADEFFPGGLVGHKDSSHIAAAKRLLRPEILAQQTTYPTPLLLKKLNYSALNLISRVRVFPKPSPELLCYFQSLTYSRELAPNLNLSGRTPIFWPNLNLAGLAADAPKPPCAQITVLALGRFPLFYPLSRRTYRLIRKLSDFLTSHSFAIYAKNAIFCAYAVFPAAVRRNTSGSCPGIRHQIRNRKSRLTLASCRI